MTVVRAWSIITKEKRQYAGNTGYDDELSKAYRYDSNVAGCRQISEGDMVLIRDASELVGIARIEAIEQSSGTKVMRRCPKCTRSGIKERATKLPRYRCNECTFEFAEPLEEVAEVEQFVARYGDSFRPALGGLTQTQLRAAAFKPSGQAAMEQVDIRKLEGPLLKTFPELTDFLEFHHQTRTVKDDAGAEPQDAGSAEVDAFVGSQGDRRDLVLRSIRLRRGQTSFRASLIKRYAARCQITGCDLLAVLEAAHIWPYRGKEDHHVENGLLLRTDIHTLFDLDLLAIRPDDLVVALAPRLADVPEYAGLAGRTLGVNGGVGPSRPALDRRWKTFCSRWSSGGKNVLKPAPAE